MASIPPKAREAIALARQGELSRAILSGEAALAEASEDGPLRLFIGLLHARRLDLTKAEPHLRQAARLIPHDPLPRVELARVLVGAGRLEEAEGTLAGLGSDGPQGTDVLRVRALLCQARGDHIEAARLYRSALARDGRDFESWGQLGAVLAASGDEAAAIHACQRALALRPDQPAVRSRLAELLAAAGQGYAALAAARAQARALPYDSLVRVTVARLEDLLGRPAAAEAAVKEALALDPRCGPALLALADLAERDNRIEELAALLDRASAAGVPTAETALLWARLHFRRGELEAALALVRTAPDAADGGARQELIGRICDRLGRPGEAFAAFGAMNRAGAAPGARQTAAAYRAMVAGRARATTGAWYRGWAAAAPSSPERPSPIFLFGFPRSGTTLLDTMLAGHPELCVIEEQPMLFAAAEALGDWARVAEIGPGEVAALRGRYFTALDRIAPHAAGRRIVDKLPLGIAETALAHRLFPDARFIFAERHPCDVVLSGFMARFDPKGGMANFLDLDDLAALYDAVMTLWHRSRESFGLPVHEIRYERMVAGPEAELRPLAEFLGLAWDPRLVDHQASARARRHIGTPSYAQVAEPLYTRARGRWEAYREPLAPILPVLAPWCRAMGYDL